MKQHERESFVYMIRFGKIIINNKVVICPPRIDQLVESYRIYDEIYEQSIQDDIMTEDQMLTWLKENLIWTKFNETRLTNLKKELEDLKVLIYESRQDPKKVKQVRFSIRQTESDIQKELNIKNSEYEHTCECIASTARISWLISNTTYESSALYDFSDTSLNKAVSLWQDSILSDTQCRDLVINEPWKSTWSISKSSHGKLFFNKDDEDLTLNQKNMIVWSQIYDNIYESMDCPPKHVIEDNDMLDGWLIIQNKKQEKSKHESEAEALVKNPKIKNSQEVLIMAGSAEHAKNIYELNDNASRALVQQRFAAVEKQGSIAEENLPDQKLNIHLQKMQHRKG